MVTVNISIDHATLISHQRDVRKYVMYTKRSSPFVSFFFIYNSNESNDNNFAFYVYRLLAFLFGLGIKLSTVFLVVPCEIYTGQRNYFNHIVNPVKRASLTKLFFFQ